MLEFNNLDEMQPYYDEETNTYIFYDDIKISFNLSIRSNIKALDIKALDIKALDIKARNIYARDIDAMNIKAVDINVLDIDAWDIDYWAVCFAYNNIKCKSIRGERYNHKHFVLDGKLEVENEV